MRMWQSLRDLICRSEPLTILTIAAPFPRVLSYFPVLSGLSTISCQVMPDHHTVALGITRLEGCDLRPGVQTGRPPHSE
jgi:hypothetical protein